MTSRRAFHTATLLSSGKVLIAGGYNFDVPGELRSAEIYDPATEKFTPTVHSMNVARYGHTATLLADGEVLIAGGDDISSNNDIPIGSAELYNPRTGTFRLTGSLNVARYSHTANFLSTAQTIVNGGSDGNRHDFLGTELYTPPGAINLGSPASGDTVSSTVVINPEYSDAVGSIRVFVDGIRQTNGVPPIQYSWDTTQVPNGPHEILVQAFKDAAEKDRIGTSSVQVNVANGPVALAWPRTGTTVSHKVVISPQSDPTLTKVIAYVDGKFLASSSLPETFYWNSDTAPNGQHTISIRGFDSSGKSSGVDSVLINVSN